MSILNFEGCLDNFKENAEKIFEYHLYKIKSVEKLLSNYEFKFGQVVVINLLEHDENYTYKWCDKFGIVVGHSFSESSTSHVANYIVYVDGYNKTSHESKIRALRDNESIPSDLIEHTITQELSFMTTPIAKIKTFK